MKKQSNNDKIENIREKGKENGRKEERMGSIEVRWQEVYFSNYQPQKGRFLH